jgi:hypothetical protein
VDAVNAFTPMTGPAVERDVARDLAKHAAYIAPAAIAISWIVRGRGGAIGAAFAVALVAVNYLLAASLITWGAQISAAALTMTALGGFAVRLALITIVGIGVKHLSFVDFPTFAILLVVTHLGLLFWEMRSISLSMASPGLKPKKEKR